MTAATTKGKAAKAEERTKREFKKNLGAKLQVALKLDLTFLYYYF